MAVHLSRTHEELAYVQRLSVQVLAATCLLQFVSQLFLNGSLLLPLQTKVTRLGFWELYLVRTGGFLVGSLMPVAGGLAVRLAYLRNRGLTYLDFTWATCVEQRARAWCRSGRRRPGDWRSLDHGGPPASGRARRLGGRPGDERGRRLLVFEYLPGLTRRPPIPAMAVAVRDEQPSDEPVDGDARVRALPDASRAQLRDVRAAVAVTVGRLGRFSRGRPSLRADEPRQNGEHHPGQSGHYRVGRGGGRQECSRSISPPD